MPQQQQARMLIDVTARKHSGQLARDVLIDNINILKERHKSKKLLLKMSFETAEKILNTSLEEDWITSSDPEEKAFFCECEVKVQPLSINKIAIIW